MSFKRKTNDAEHALLLLGCTIYKKQLEECLVEKLSVETPYLIMRRFNIITTVSTIYPHKELIENIVPHAPW
jgi:hypothetical protein